MGNKAIVACLSDRATVREVETVRPGAASAVQDVLQTIARYGDSGRAIRAVMLERLGPNVWHDTPAGAMVVLEELEETARLVLLALPAAAEPLTESHIDELRQTFGARW